MPIEATSQTTPGMVYVLNGNDDLNVGAGVVLFSETSDAILANSGQHVITVSGTVKAYDDAINTIGCEAAQTVVIASDGLLMAGYTGVELNGDGVILDGIGSTLVNDGTIFASGSGLSLFVRDAGTTKVTNNGYIFGEQFGIWNKFGIGTLVVTNTGTIESAGASFFGGTGKDHLTNAGIMKGDVLLNGGDDIYLGTGGVVYGLINGGDGNDRFVLGTAPDKVDGGFGFDTLDFSLVTTRLTINLEHSSWSLGAVAVGDTYANIEEVIGGTVADRLTGDLADNVLWGMGGSDLLQGGDGQDRLIGGQGKDTLTGGAGADTFIFERIRDFGDSATDFTQGLDRLQLSGSAIGVSSIEGGLDPSSLHISTSNLASEWYHRLIFNTTNSTLWFDKDGSGTRFTASLVVDLQDGALLTAASIDIV
jgi:Ca2+-binding RTX toxin-like protein